MGHGTVRFERRGAVARVALNRPEVRNAFNDKMLEDLLEIFRAVENDEALRVVVVTGEGDAFCAGADLNWMRRVLEYSFEENYQGSMRLAEMLRAVYTCPKPVVGRINGPAVGGGTGVVAACDIAVATDDASFRFSETKLGLAPAVIAPFLLKRMGERYLRELFLTGQRFSAARAAEMGLVNAAVPAAELDSSVDAVVEMILTGGPAALAASKELIRETVNLPLESSAEFTAKLIARLRMSDEGQEGMGAFLEKRKPKWIEDSE